MNKPTADKCRERIKKFKRLKKQFGIAMETELSLQAFEIALPILEQQERGCQKCGGTGMADSGGTQPWGEQILVECDCKFEQQGRGEGEWVEWGGGERPCDYRSVVEVRLRSGNERRAGALSWEWKHHNSICDIIAYRIIPERATNQNGEQ